MAQLDRSSPMTINPDWIDYNGHLNMAFYSVLFDHGIDQLWEEFGLGPDYREARGMTTYTAEFHIRYLRELHLGDAVTATCQIIDIDDKRIHTYQELLHSDGWLAATGESLFLSIDQSGPKVAPFPADIAERIAAMARDHATLPRPDGAGRSIGIGRRTA